MPSVPLPFDVAIVLGAAVAADGGPSLALARRTRHGAALMRKGAARYLLLTGGAVRRRPAEAVVMRRLAVAEGVPEDKIILEAISRNTLENVTNCLDVIARHEWKRVLVISDPFHLPRALYTFRRFGIAATGEAPPTDGGRLPNLRPWLREALAMPFHVVRTEYAVRRRTWRSGR